MAVQGLSVRYGGAVALVDVDLDVAAGTVVGLIGPNGAGKTTFIDALTGFVRTAGGRITFDGRSLDRLGAHARARAGIARTFQSMELFEDLTVGENLAVAARGYRWWSVVTDALRLASREVPPVVADSLGTLGLGNLGEVMASELSHGERKLVGVARALAASPKLLVLDEPAAGLDPDERVRLGAHLRRVAESGTGVLLVDHDMGLVLEVCDVVWVLDFGAIIASGPPEVIRADTRVIEAYLGAGLEGAAEVS